MRMEPKRAAATRPAQGEYAPYYETYISRVKGNDIVGILDAQRLQMAQLFAARSERDGNFRYAPDKWTVKEVLGHVTDTDVDDFLAVDGSGPEFAALRNLVGQTSEGST